MLTPQPDYDSGWSDIREQLREALTVRVPGTLDREPYEKCLMTLIVGAFPNYRCAYLPKGFLKALLKGLDDNGDTYSIVYNKIYVPVVIDYSPICLKPHQEEAVQRIMDRHEGVICAPPASGKTVITLEAIRRLKLRSLIIVDKKNLIDQWSDRCKEFLGMQPDVISEGFTRGSGSPITIGMQQSLRELVRLGNGKEMDNYGLVCLDECHHISAETYTNVLEKFSAAYRIGLSATPYRDDGLDMISKLVIGPVIYKITSEELEAGRYILKPKIERVETHFTHDFWSTHSVSKTMICDKPNCPKNGKAHSHRNNYMTVTKALVEDYDRNYFIAHRITQNKDNCNLVVSDRLAHLDTLRELSISRGFPAERTHMLTGKETPAERAEVSRVAAYGACAIFSTIAKEALDIPRLDRLYLTWPIKREHILEQQIGRITRTHPDKRDAIVYDYVDENTSVLNSQAWNRFKYYKSKNYDIN